MNEKSSFVLEYSENLQRDSAKNLETKLVKSEKNLDTLETLYRMKEKELSSVLNEKEKIEKDFSLLKVEFEQNEGVIITIKNELREVKENYNSLKEDYDFKLEYLQNRTKSPELNHERKSFSSGFSLTKDLKSTIGSNDFATIFNERASLYNKIHKGSLAIIEEKGEFDGKEMRKEKKESNFRKFSEKEENKLVSFGNQLKNEGISELKPEENLTNEIESKDERKKITVEKKIEEIINNKNIEKETIEKNIEKNIDEKNIKKNVNENKNEVKNIETDKSNINKIAPEDEKDERKKIHHPFFEKIESVPSKKEPNSLSIITETKQKKTADQPFTHIVEDTKEKDLGSKKPTAQLEYRFLEFNEATFFLFKFLKYIFFLSKIDFSQEIICR